MKFSRLILFFFISTLLFSCGQDMTSSLSSGGSTSSSSSSTSSSNCYCTTEVDPVCAYTNSKQITFRNGCLAQCAGLRYNSGECSSDDCDSDSGPVCGILDEGKTPSVYTDECALLRAGADQVSDSRCGI